MTKAILVKAEVDRSFPRVLTFYRWHCRICGKDGRVWRWDWHYIAYLGVQHMRAQHPEVNPPAVSNVESEGN